MNEHQHGNLKGYFNIKYIFAMLLEQFQLGVGSRWQFYGQIVKLASLGSFYGSLQQLQWVAQLKITGILGILDTRQFVDCKENDMENNKKNKNRATGPVDNIIDKSKMAIIHKPCTSSLKNPWTYDLTTNLL